MMEQMDEESKNDQYGEMDDVEEEMDIPEDDSAEVNYQQFKNVITKTEDAGKDQTAQAREANYISKGTYIWQLLS